MSKILDIPFKEWTRSLEEICRQFEVYAPIERFGNIDYEKITDKAAVNGIIYNQPKPVTPLKSFFLPYKENVTTSPAANKQRIIIGPPACDLEALWILDEIYLDDDYRDTYYAHRRENTLLIGFDCHDHLEHCHCTAYGFNPWPGNHADLVISTVEDRVVIEVRTEKGRTFTNKQLGEREADPGILEQRDSRRQKTKQQLRAHNSELPDYKASGTLVANAPDETWEKYASDCISCGACSAICPTCTCFLLIEREGFEKVRNLDTCQYPGFERVAAGEDPLRALAKRFRNRYMCKYYWKPQKFESLACTGCGRCIEACIGKINKNELLKEVNVQKEHVTR